MLRMATRGATGTGRLVAALVIAAALAIGACSETTPLPVAIGPAAVTIVARNIAFEPATLTVAAGVALDVRFENRDADVPHNLILLAGPQFSTTLSKSEIVTGPAALDISIAGLAPGRYRFACEVHPMMTTDLTVGG